MIKLLMRSVFCLELTVFLVCWASAQWVQTNGPYGGRVTVLAASGDTILAGTTFGVFYSENGGNDWVEISFGPNTHISKTVNSLAVIKGNLFAGAMAGGLLRSTDKGISWNQVNSGLSNFTVLSFAEVGDTIFIGTFDGVYLSTNNGSIWTPANSGIEKTAVTSLAVIGNTLFAGTGFSSDYCHGVFTSVDHGATWKTANSGLTDTVITSLVVIEDILFAATDNNRVFLSSDKGASWKVVTSLLSYGYVRSLVASGGNIFAGFQGDGVLLSTDKGVSWKVVKLGSLNREDFVYSLAANGSALFAGTDAGIFRLTNNGATWNAVNSGITNTKVISLAAADGVIVAGVENSAVFLSTNNGVSWNEIASGLAGWSLAIRGNDIFTAGGRVYHSADKGLSWSAADTSLSAIQVLALNGDTIYAAGHGVFRSIDNGKHWDRVSSGFTTRDTTINSLLVSDGALFAGTKKAGIFISTDNGAHWTATGLATKQIGALARCGGNIFAGSQLYGLFRSADNGKTWDTLNSGLTNPYIFSFAVSGGALFASTTANGNVILSTDNGTSWKQVNSGLPDCNITSFAVNGGNIFAAAYGGGVWRRPLSEMKIPVSDRPRLETTPHAHCEAVMLSRDGSPLSITITVPHTCRVAVTLYDLAGRAILFIVNNSLGAGTYQYCRDVHALAQGCYILKMYAGTMTSIQPVRIMR